MEKKRGFLRVYLIIALIMGILGLFDSIFALTKVSITYYPEIVALLVFVFFWFNLTALIFFIYQRLEKITYVLPIYHIAIYILFTALGILLYAKGLVDAVDLSLMSSAGILAALFEIGFSVYLLMRFGVSPIAKKQ